MSKAQQDYLEELRQIHERRLQELEKQAAARGIDTPPQIRTEIKDIKDALSQLDAQVPGRERPTGLVVPSKSWFNSAWLLYLLVILIFAIGIFIGRFLTGDSQQPALGSSATVFIDAGKQTAIAELQPTITSLQQTSFVVLTPASTSVVTDTQTAMSTPKANDGNLFLADLHFKVETYEDMRLPRGSNHLSVETTGDRNRISDIYKLDFTLPISKAADLQTGFQIELFGAEDIRQYKSLKFLISFSDENAKCGIFVKSSENKFKYIPLGEGTYVFTGVGEQPVEVPVKDILKEIPSGLVYTIIIYSSSVFTDGNHSIKIRDIRFER